MTSRQLRPSLSSGEGRFAFPSKTGPRKREAQPEYAEHKAQKEVIAFGYIEG